jgi:adhesin transport system membrane fusion protein
MSVENQKKPTYMAVEPPLPRSSYIVWIIALACAAFLAWAWTFKLDEVSTGGGKVVPSSKEQTIQSLDGGIVKDLKVKEGDIVEKDQVLAFLDATRVESNVGESTSRLHAAQATSARLMAEVTGRPLAFPASIQADSKLIREETALYYSRRANLDASVAGFKQALSLVRQELVMTEPLVEKGAASEVEVLRLRREINDLQNKLNDVQNQYMVQAREDLAKANAEIEAQGSVVRGKSDSLTRLKVTSPMRGIIKEITVTTVGGVIPPNGKFMVIVPLDEQLLVEARIAPRDIAFIHPNQDALVKVTAYDYSIYGGLKGKVTVISPDTIQDEVKRDTYYYRVYIRTDLDHLTNKTGEKFPILPGMVTTVDIHTGNKTVLDYLIKPLNKAKEALRER